MALLLRVSCFMPRHVIVRSWNNMGRVGNRDYVGFGKNGIACYQDCALFPFPSIRWKENTPDVLLMGGVLQALREKEKGDWTLLTKEEKKCLYRASFCQTFAEFKAPTGSWKYIIGWVLILITFSFWSVMYLHFFVHEPLPNSLTDESQAAQLRRMLELHVNPIDGLSSKWDYKEDRWK